MSWSWSSLFDWQLKFESVYLFICVLLVVLGGYSVTVDGKSETIRGTRIGLTNPFPLTVISRDVRLNATLQQPISYTFTHTLFGTHECPSTTAISLQLTQKGMYQSNPDLDYVTLPPRNVTNFLSPSVPQPPQAAQASRPPSSLYFRKRK